MSDTPTPITDAALIDNADMADWGTGNSGYVRADDMRLLEQATRRLLNEILDHQIAGRGTSHTFYRCYTYGKEMPPWVKKTEKLLAKHTKGTTT